ncbi:hypothetical protein Tco_1438903 [Tanacetum coccineum]
MEDATHFSRSSGRSILRLQRSANTTGRLSILNMKAALLSSDAGLEQMVPGSDLMEEECKPSRLGQIGVQIMRFNEIHKFSDDTLHQIDEALDYRVKEFRVNRRNPGLDTRFWTKKDVDKQSLCLPYRNDLRQDVSSGIWKALLVAG